MERRVVRVEDAPRWGRLIYRASGGGEGVAGTSRSYPRGDPGACGGGTMNAPTTGLPCGRRLNCRNGFPWMRMKRRRTRKPIPQIVPDDDGERPPFGNVCNGCGETVPKRRRYCDPCRTERRRATWRGSQNRRRRRLAGIAAPWEAQEAVARSSGVAEASSCPVGHGAITVDKVDT